jgi:hypothetical protein
MINMIRGERFNIDLLEHQTQTGAPSLALPFVRDVQERPAAAATATAPTPPRFKTTASGFPEHKSRTAASRFKSQKSAVKYQTPLQASNPLGMASPPTKHDDASTISEEKRHIDQENRARLAQMSPEEIDQERREVMSGLSASLVERLLKRANIDQGRNDLPEADSKFKDEITLAAPEAIEKESHEPPPPAESPTPSKKVSFATSLPPLSALTHDPEAPPAIPPPDLLPASATPLPPAPNIHFPPAPPAPALDPSSPDFLQNLREKYFPDLPADPSKMAWMAPLPTEHSPADKDSPYYPGQDSLPISSLRFDFRGRLLPPKLARQIPTTKGLHHHGQAPEAAGYTVPELCILMRSAVPSQRCVAYQTLGRILYRLGRGDFGAEDDELCQGLWKAMEEGRVVDTISKVAAGGEGGNRSCWVLATEAVWLWRMGGVRKWKAN